jgi:hypothetical protein
MTDKQPPPTSPPKPASPQRPKPDQLTKLQESDKRG